MALIDRWGMLAFTDRATTTSTRRVRPRRWRKWERRHVSTQRRKRCERLVAPSSGLPHLSDHRNQARPSITAQNPLLQQTVASHNAAAARIEETRANGSLSVDLAAPHCSMSVTIALRRWLRSRRRDQRMAAPAIAGRVADLTGKAECAFRRANVRRCRQRPWRSVPDWSGSHLRSATSTDRGQSLTGRAQVAFQER